MSAQNDKSRKSVLFVSFGNICRSPLVEGMFRDMIRRRDDREDWTIDSCATGPFHVGEEPDERCTKLLRLHGVHHYHHIGRRVTQEDFDKFHYILGMDEVNMEALRALRPDSFRGTLALLGSFDPENTTMKIRDPYYDNDDKGFKLIYQLAKRACTHFLEDEGFQQAPSNSSAIPLVNS